MPVDKPTVFTSVYRSRRPPPPVGATNGFNSFRFGPPGSRHAIRAPPPYTLALRLSDGRTDGRRRRRAEPVVIERDRRHSPLATDAGPSRVQIIIIITTAAGIPCGAGLVSTTRVLSGTSGIRRLIYTHTYIYRLWTNRAVAAGPGNAFCHTPARRRKRL